MGSLQRNANNLQRKCKQLANNLQTIFGCSIVDILLHLQAFGCTSLVTISQNCLLGVSFLNASRVLQ